jgi:hypothetical protein
MGTAEPQPVRDRWAGAARLAKKETGVGHAGASLFVGQGFIFALEATSFHFAISLSTRSRISSP